MKINLSFRTISVLLILLIIQNGHAQIGNQIGKIFRNTTGVIKEGSKLKKQVEEIINKKDNNPKDVVKDKKPRIKNEKNQVDIAFDSIFDKPYQNVTSNLDSQSSFYKVSKDFYIDIRDLKKKYPRDYKPFWNLINGNNEITFNVYNQLQNRNGTDKAILGVFDYEGNAYIKTKGFSYSCDCAGRLVETNKKVLITKSPQSFIVDKLYVFEDKYDPKQKKMITKVTDKPCINLSGSFYDQGGWNVKLNLSRDEIGNLIVSSAVESLVANQNLITRNGTNIGKKWTVKDFLIENRLSPEKANLLIANKRADSIKQVEKRLKEIEEIKQFEIEIKDSYSKIAKKQNDYDKYESDFRCLKKETGQKYEYITTTEKRWVVVSIDYSEWEPKTETEEQNVPVTKEILVDYEGLKNTCDKTLVIKGISKLISESGTIYYEDASIILEPNEMTNEMIEIENDYNPKKAKIDTTCYYKNKLRN